MLKPQTRRLPYHPSCCQTNLQATLSYRVIQRYELSHGLLMYTVSRLFQHRRGCGGCWGSWMNTTWRRHPAQHWTASHALKFSSISRRFCLCLCLCSGSSKESHEVYSWFQLICLRTTQFTDQSTASLIILLEFWLLIVLWADPSGRSLAGVLGSNPARNIDVSIVSVMCFQVEVCVKLITRPEESYRVWCVWVWSWILDNEVLAHWGLSCQCRR